MFVFLAIFGHSQSFPLCEWRYITVDVSLKDLEEGEEFEDGGIGEDHVRSCCICARALVEQRRKLSDVSPDVIIEVVEVLEDLVTAAINDAKAKADQEMQSRMQDMTGGLGLPAGFKLPF